MKINNKNLIAYVNGEYVPLDSASISIMDLGFTNSEMIYDTFRTFNKVPFFINEHLKRLKFASKYSGIEITLKINDIKKIILKLLKKNLKHIKKHEDLWCFIRFTRSKSVIIEMRKLNFSNYAPFYKNGLKLYVPSLRRIPSQYLDPNVKNSSSYFTLSLAREEIWKFDRTANAILLDEKANINEGYGFNIFFVKKGKIFTPKSKNVLPGTTRQKVIEISKKMNLKPQEKNIKLKDIVKYEEAFVTATGWGICPVKSINKIRFNNFNLNNNLTNKIQANYSKMVKINITKQYLNFLK